MSQWNWHCLHFHQPNWPWPPQAHSGYLRESDGPVVVLTVCHLCPDAMEYVIETWHVMSIAMTDSNCVSGGNLPSEFLRTCLHQMINLVAKIEFFSGRNKCFVFYVPWTRCPWTRFPRANFPVVAIHTIPWCVSRFSSTNCVVWRSFPRIWRKIEYFI